MPAALPRASSALRPPVAPALAAVAAARVRPRARRCRRAFLEKAAEGAEEPAMR
jgi:hypothetical protein